MSAQANTAENLTASNSVTTISANARVDYVHRFSKQAVLVIDDDLSQCSTIGSQYLASIGIEKNTAYLNVSPRLDDLQVRCRIVEQLFGQQLFDPELSIAVTLFNLLKKDRQPVAVVIESAHHLSLHLLHELCQLAEIAKKAEFPVQVLMLGLPLAGQKMAQHPVMFNKKVSILAAKTGQLISLSSKELNPSASWFSMSGSKKLALLILSLTALSTVIIYQLYQRDVLSFSTFINDSLSLNSPITSDNTKSNKADVMASEVLAVEDVAIIGQEKLSASFPMATSADVLIALTPPTSVNAIDLKLAPEKASKPAKIINGKETIQADPLVIAQSLVIEPSPLPSDTQVNTEEPVTKTLAPTNIAFLQDKKDAVNYYADKAGFVVQISGFSQERVMQEFIADYGNVEFHQYQRILNNAPLMILTTQIYPTRELAEQALLELPQAIQDRGPWLKSVALIQQEIADYQSSQSVENQDTIAAQSQ